MCPYCTTNICWNMLRKVFYTSRFRFECIYHMLPHVKDKCPYVRLCLGRFMKRRLCISLSRLEMPQIIKIEINLNQSVLRKNIRLCLREGFKKKKSWNFPTLSGTPPPLPPLKLENIQFFFYMTRRANFFIKFFAYSGHETYNIKNQDFQKNSLLC